MANRSDLSIVPVMVVLGRAERALSGSILPQAGDRGLAGRAIDAMLPGASLPADGVVVIGFGRATAGPDVVTVSFATERCGTELAVVMREAATKTGRAVDAARGLGVPEEDIRATGCNLWTESAGGPRTGACDGGVTYRVSKHIEVSLRDPDQLGPLVRAVTGTGAFTLTGVNFSASDPSSLIRFQSLLMSLEDE